MHDEEPIDYEAIRARFPWVGLVSTGENDMSVRYRELMAEPDVIMRSSRQSTKQG